MQVDLQDWPDVTFLDRARVLFGVKCWQVKLPLPKQGRFNQHLCELGSRDECEDCRARREAEDVRLVAEMKEQRVVPKMAKRQVKEDSEWER